MKKEFNPPIAQQKRALPPADLFDYMALFIDALDQAKLRSIGNDDYLIDEDYLPESPARLAAVSMTVNYLVMGYDYANYQQHGSVVSSYELTEAGYKGMIIIDNALKTFNPDKARKRLDVLKSIMRVNDMSDLNIDYDADKDVVFGPVHEDYLETMDIFLCALNCYFEDPKPQGEGQIFLSENVEDFRAVQVDGGYALVTSRENCKRLLHVGRFDPFVYSRVGSVWPKGDLPDNTAGSELTAWIPDMRMC